MKNLSKSILAGLALLLISSSAAFAQSQPTVAACCLTLNSQSTTSVNFDWVRGNGDYCLVVMRATSSTFTYPTDGNTYSYSTSFGGGSNIGNANYVVYKGTGTSITVSNLTPGTYYEAMVYEFNSLTFPYVPNYTTSYGFLYMYALANAPTVSPSGLTAYNINSTSVYYSWTPGNGSYSILGVRQANGYVGTPVDGTEYSSSTCFGSGNSIGTSSPYAYSIYDGVSSNLITSCLSPGTDYSAGVFTYNGTSGANNYYTSGSYEFFTTLSLEPTVASNWLYVTDITDNAFTVNWMKPSGSGSYSLVTVKQGTSNTNAPVDMTVYTANSVYGSGSQVGTGAYVVYNSSGNSVRVTGLTTGTQYTVSVWEFNGFTGTYNNTHNYLTTSYPTQQTQTNDPEPTASSTSLVLTPSTNSVTASWTNGNGAKHVALMKPTRVSTALAFDGTTDFVSVPYSSVEQPSSAISIEAWAFKSNWATSSGWQTIAGNQEGVGGSQLFLFNSYAYAYSYKTGSSCAVYNDVSYLTPGWHHFAMTSDGRYTALYVDGAKKAEYDLGGTYSQQYAYSNNFIIGADAGTGSLPTGNYFNGYIDEVRVWSTARTYSEIRQNMFTSLKGNESGLIGEWKMDDGYAAGTTVKNNSLNYYALDGTTSSMPTTAASSFTGTSGWILSGSGANEPIDFGIYTANNAFMFGAVVGDNYYSVYNNTSNSVTVTNLTPGTWYNFSVYDFNTTVYNNFKTDAYLTQDFQTTAVPIPTITSVTPSFGGLGLIDSINGTNFDGTTPSNNIVYYGREKATVISATTTKIKAIVPYCTSNSPVSVTVNSQSAFSVKPFDVSSSCSATISNTSFTSGSIAGGSSRQGTASGDIDQDGKSDLIYVDANLSLLYINKNTSINGALSWGATYTNPVSYPSEVEVGDLDGDGRLDIITVSTTTNLVSVFRCKTPSSFLFDARQDFPALPNSSTNIALADIDKDGRPDIVVSYASGSYFSVFRNTSSIGFVSFAQRVDISGVSGPYSVKAGEIDGDGKPDVVAGNYSGTSFTAFRNISTVGNISFSAGVSVSTGQLTLSISLFDLDADGDNDVIAGLTSGTIQVYKNNNTSGNITAPNFSLQSTLTGLTSSPNTDVYDLDGDQKNDIVSGYYGGANIAVFEALTNFTFSAAVTLTGTSSGSPWLTLDDFSLDGKTDIVAGTGGTTISTFNNVMNPLASEPTTAASAINFTGVTQTGMTVNFTAGSGASRIVIARQGSPVNVFPFDGTGYTPNTIFGQGTDLGGGNYVVYNGNGNTVSITGLQSYTPYYYAIFEFNGSTCTANYLTSPYVTNNNMTLNTPPTINAISNPGAICQSSGLQVVNFSGVGTGAVNEVQTLTVTATSNNQSLVANGNITVNYTSPNPTGSISYTPTAAQYGTAIITVVVNDNAANNNTTQQTFTVTVNQSPSTSNAGPNQYICTSSTSLAANTPTVGTGTWSFIYTSNGSINIANLNSPISAISNFGVNDSVRLAWTITNAPCSPSVTFVSIKRNSCPLDANFSANQTNVCGSSANITYTDLSTVTSGFITAWSWSFPGGTPSSATGQGPHIVAYSAPGQYTSSLQVTDNAATTNTEIKVNYVTLTAFPGAPGTITGNLTVCQGQTGATYSVPPISAATSYVWTVPTGGNIISGQGTTNIVVDYNNTAATGNVTVHGVNSCGNGSTGFQLVTVNPLPANTPAITGALTVCQGQTGVTYSVGAINNATGYSWVIPNGASITSGNNTQNITVTYSNSAVSGIVNVYGTNTCGTGVSTSAINITVNPLPNAAGAITGTTTVCQNDTVVYSITALGNTTGYNWSLPTGASIIAGNNTNSITVFYNTSAVSGNISVMGTNSCGNGTSASLGVTVNPLPANATSIVGSVTVCAGDNSEIYFVSSITNAANYIWSLPPGFTIVTGNNTNAIQVSISPTAQSGTLSVYGNNACGDGASSSINITVSPLPDSAGTITGQDTVCQAQTGVVYSVPLIGNATGYNWSLPLGASITAGNNTNSITVDFSNAALSGYVTVIGTNTCGNGLDVDSFAVTVNPLPGDALSISGDSSIQICPIQTGVVYTTPVVANATSYSWSLPVGANIVAGNNTNSITVDYTVGAQSGFLSVTPTNACGTGATVTVPINVDTVLSVPICMVTVNNASSYNHVVWEKPVTTQIDSFRIYREITNTFQQIGSVPYSAYSEYVDSIYTPLANPNNTNYRYKISAIDSCGNESRISLYHRTIFLQASQGVGNTVNLNWVQYEGGPNDTIYQYYIFRDTVGTGNLDLIDSVPGGNMNYTDNNPSQNITTLRYVLGVDWNITCNPSFKIIPHTMAAVNTSHSNIKNLIYTPNAVINMEQQYGMSIFPNPNNGLFNITLKNLGNKSCSYTIFDVVGEVVMKNEINGNSSQGALTRTIDLTSLANGVYTIRLEIDGSQVTKKLVIQK